MYNNISQLEVEILVNGRPAKEYAHNWKTYVQANHGSTYTIRIRNNYYNRRLAVVTVDGINVVDGNAGASSKAGYVINGYSSYEVPGFRTSNEEAHPFKFNVKQRSYASKSPVTEGDTSNCGVIGVEIYEEKAVNVITIRPTPFPKYSNIRRMDYTTGPENDIMLGSDITTDWSSDSCHTFSCCLSEQTRGINKKLGNINADSLDGIHVNMCQVSNETVPEFDMGTEFSKYAVEDRVVETNFDIGTLVSTFTVYYASKDALRRAGVPIVAQKSVAFPNPFPSKFCPFPSK